MKKRTLSILLVLILVIGAVFTGCGASSDDNTNAGASEYYNEATGKYIFDGNEYTPEELWEVTGAKYNAEDDSFYGLMDSEEAELYISTTRLVSETETSAVIEVDYTDAEKAATVIMLKESGEWVVDLVSF